MIGLYVYLECTRSDSRMSQESHIRCSEGLKALEIILSLYGLKMGGMFGITNLISCICYCKTLKLRRLMSKKNNKDKWQWYYHFHIWQIVPDILKFGLKGAWQKQDKASKIFIIIFLVLILFQLLGVWELIISIMI